MTQEAGPSRSVSMPSSTPAVPRAYPNLQTATQLKRTLSFPREFRRTASRQEDCLRVLKSTFKKPDFRGRQREIMEAAVRGADVLVVAPTGMGKSLCFQVPAVADHHGITVVISPLLSLMKNQVDALRGYGVKVHLLSSESTMEERQEIEKDLASGHPLARLLYLTPEALFSRHFLKSLRRVVTQRELRRLVIDEAHCISEWGSSFRPEYRKLGFFRETFPNVPIMALTASATARVQKDILQSLKMDPKYLYRCVEPFNRTNLYYEVRYRPEPDHDRLEDVKAYILALHKRAPPNIENPAKRSIVSGIIYCRSKALCDAVAEFLSGNGIKARPFYRGLKGYTLDDTLQKWLSGDIDCVVATIAFGMGIDKPDVRYVVHFDLPKSFEGYYQETGRAGRDGRIAKCLLYYSREDAWRLRRLVMMEEGRKKKGKEKESSETDDDLHSGLDSFKTVQHFAEDTKTCRHIAICRYFGEKIDEQDPAITELYCRKMCDVCANPEKVALRASNLTEDVVVASQVPKRKECDLDSLAPVNTVNFYNLDIRQALAPTREETITSTKQTVAAGPTPQPAPPKILPIPQVNPYAAAVAASIPARRPFGLSSNTNRPVPPPARKQPTYTIVENPLPKAAKKMKTVETSPYAASPSLAANGTFKKPATLKPFKTPFATTQPSGVQPATVQRAKTRLTQSSSLDIMFDEGELEVLAQCSQKIGVSLRNAGLKSVIKALGRAMTPENWLRLLGAATDSMLKAQDKNKAILVAAKDSEYDILCMSVTPDGYSTRIEELVSAIDSASAWNALLTRQDSLDDAEDDEVITLRALEKNLLAYCNKASRRSS
ncbi:hypothetical protein NliqN6_6220 [Naganishia liquefaciens]|uniref:ATP-dependent DNA helicase n=1 Tax=Naganishia liquefaciens TaxID=104408 RepID=A0A8H3TZA6_9TREE|nr:hypothetical protein NliqN6_6220 [Naganishia liquefaciens]